MGFSQNFRRANCFGLRIFSLLALFLGIFSLPCEGSFTVPLSLPANQIYDASFSFNIGTFQNRNVFIDKASFDASGTLSTYSTIIATTTGFDLWENSFATSSWQAWAASISPAIAQSLAMRQLLKTDFPNANFATDTLYFSRITLTKNLSLFNYTPGLLLQTTLDTPRLFSGNAYLTPHAMILSRKRCHLAWIDATTLTINIGYWDGAAVNPVTGVLAPGYSPDKFFGLGGNLIWDGVTPMVAVTYVASDTGSPTVMLFDENYAPVGGGTKTFDAVSLVSCDSKIAISQNPRTGKIFLGYVSSDNKGRVITASFSAGVWTLGTTATLNFGDSISNFENAGLSNFENSFGFQDSADSKVYEWILRAGAWSKSWSFGAAYHSTMFPARFNNRDCLGILLLASPGNTNYSVNYRYLIYPQNFRWQPGKNVLHIEGPPTKDTMVGVEATFPEMATAASLVNSANAGGGKVQIHGTSGVLVTSGTQFTLRFDAPMKQASYTEWINTTNLIRLFDNGNVATGSIAHVPAADTATSVTFVLGANLGFDATYSVYIASDVFSATGTQLWSNATFTFHTQKAQSSPLPGEIQGLAAYYDASFLTLATNGFEINATNTLYFRMTSTDPASNTTDVTSLSYILDGAFIASFTLTQPAASSPYFDGSYSVTGLTPGNHALIFQSASGTVLASFPVGFPAWSSQAPPNGATGVTIYSNIVITFSEALATATVKKQNIVLSQGGIPASYSLAFAGNVVTIDPDDTPENGLIPLTNYQVGVGPLITDLIGNPYVAVATTTTTFTTGNAFSNLAFYADAAYSQVIPDGANVDPTDILRVEILGPDLQFGVTDSISASFTDTLSTTTLTLVEDAPGRYRGFFLVPNFPGKNITVTLASAPSNVGSLKISPIFAMESVNPANGTVGVSADMWPTWTFTRVLDLARITADRFVVKEVVTGNQLPGTLVRSIDGRQVVFRPAAFFPLLKNIELSVASDVADTKGKTLGAPFVTRFTVQPPPNPPSVIDSLENFRTSAYTVPTNFVSNDGLMYLQVTAQDSSPGAIGVTWVRIDSSDSRMRGVDVVLTETGPNTGVYRGSAIVKAFEGATVYVLSRADPTFALSLTVRTRPFIENIEPASGSANIALDQNFRISFSRPMKTGGMKAGFKVNTPAGDAVDFNVSLSADERTVLLSPQSYWLKGTRHLVTIAEPFTDQTEAGVATTVFGFYTLTDIPQKLDLFSGIAPRAFQAASRVGEVLPGVVTVLATTTSLYDRLPETRMAEIVVGNTVMNVVLAEDVALPGLFSGQVTIPDERGMTGRATLQYGSNPVVNFQVAPYPALKELSPASGAIDVGEEDSIIATFNKPMAPEIASGALRVSAVGTAIPMTFASPGTAPVALVWKSISGLGMGAPHTVEVGRLIDLLGQPIDIPSWQFLAEGGKGINVYEDKQFAKPIQGEILTVPEIFAEVVLLVPPQNSAERVFLKAQVQRNATSPQYLLLRPAATGSRKYRGDLKFESSRSTPRLTVPLVPGERLELTSPNLPYARRVFYYMTKERLSPATILGINVYREKHFAQKVEGDLHLGTVYVEVEAKDANWMTVDTTRIKVFSDSDPTGFEMTLIEPERHFGRYQGVFSLDVNGSNVGLAKLKARPGDRITMVSLTDPQVRYSARWSPENRIEHVRVWPSPVRGNRVTVSFYLNFPGDVEFYIYDASGEELRGVDYHGVEGENRIPWDLPGRLANGVYFFTIELISENVYKTIRQKFKGKFAILR